MSFQRQNKFYEKHKDDDDYKYMKKYSSYKSRAKSFVTKFASEQDLLNLITLINQRLEELKGLTDKMESTLNEAYNSGLHLAKNLGDVRRGFATKLNSDLHPLNPLTLNKEAKIKQEAINKWTADYLTACIQANVSAFDKFVLETDIEKKIRIAYSITGALIGDPE